MTFYECLYLCTVLKNVIMKVTNKQRWAELVKRMTHKYRLIIFDAHNYEEVGTLFYTRFSLIVFGILSFIAFVAIVVVIIVYTPLHRLLPAYTDSKLQRDILTNAIRVDSLEHQIQVRDQYFDNIKKIIQGKTPDNIVNSQTKTVNVENINLSKSKHDSILRQQVEQEEQYNLSLIDDKKTAPFDALRLRFFPRTANTSPAPMRLHLPVCAHWPHPCSTATPMAPGD